MPVVLFPRVKTSGYSWIETIRSAESFSLRIAEEEWSMTNLLFAFFFFLGSYAGLSPTVPHHFRDHSGPALLE